MNPIVFIVLFAVCVPLVLLLVFIPVIKDNKARNGVTNFDTFSRNYSYLLICSQENVVDMLSQKSDGDIMQYSFDLNSMIIRFEQLNATFDYQLSFHSIDNKTFLKVTQIHLIHDKSNIPLMLNRFFIKKIGAEPVDYQYSEGLVSLVNE